MPLPLDLPDLDIENQVSADADKLWQVVLLDDDDHTYDYVIEMLMEIFGHPLDLAYKMACDVDSQKRVVVDVDTKYSADLKCRQIKNFGPDWRMKRSKESMQAVIAPVT